MGAGSPENKDHYAAPRHSSKRIYDRGAAPPSCFDREGSATASLGRGPTFDNFYPQQPGHSHRITSSTGQHSFGISSQARRGARRYSGEAHRSCGEACNKRCCIGSINAKMATTAAKQQHACAVTVTDRWTGLRCRSQPVAPPTPGHVTPLGQTTAQPRRLAYTGAIAPSQSIHRYQLPAHDPDRQRYHDLLRGTLFS